MRDHRHLPPPALIVRHAEAAEVTQQRHVAAEAHPMLDQPPAWVRILRGIALPWLLDGQLWQLLRRCAAPAAPHSLRIGQLGWPLGYQTWREPTAGVCCVA